MNDLRFSDGLASGLDDSPNTFESKSSSIVLIFFAILESSSQLAAENVLNFFFLFEKVWRRHCSVNLLLAVLHQELRFSVRDPSLLTVLWLLDC